MNREELREISVLANAFKQGDLDLGGTADERVKEAAREALGAVRLNEVPDTAILEDSVSEVLASYLDKSIASRLSTLTIAELKTALLGTRGAAWVKENREGLSSGAIACVVKVLSDDELSRVSRSIFNPLPAGEVSIGSSAHFGSRIQPNSPGDDEEEILFSVLEGLSYGCGDVIIGLNPASDDLDTIIRLEQLLAGIVERLQLPTQYCVLSDIVKQTDARGHTAVDVGFQSLAGTSAALKGMVGLDASEIADLARGFAGFYFETGQGSEVTNGCAEGVDMVTLESRTYGVARYIRSHARDEAGLKKWMIVNDVSGFIGPEVFRTADQLQRTCLEDSVMAKLHGLTMGLDVCATFHMGIDPQTLSEVTARILNLAAPAYLMAIAGGADPMLGYMTTPFREHPRLREISGKRVTSKMSARLGELGIMDSSGELRDAHLGAAELYAMYQRASGDSRTRGSLVAEGAQKISNLQQRGFDIGYEVTSELTSRTRMQAIYSHARQSLYARLDDGVINQVCPNHIRVRTVSRDRDEYISRPATGETIHPSYEEALRSLFATKRPQVQIIVSDGLNANAVNENVRELLPALRAMLMVTGLKVASREVVIDNGRVRAGYRAAELLGPDILVHLIGERPGTGLNTLSAYLTYGRDPDGHLRWSSNLDHSVTTAVCGINRRGRPPVSAAREICDLVKRIAESRHSGVNLHRSRPQR